MDIGLIPVYYIPFSKLQNLGKILSTSPFKDVAQGKSQNLQGTKPVDNRAENHCDNILDMSSTCHMSLVGVETG